MRLTRETKMNRGLEQFGIALFVICAGVVGALKSAGGKLLFGLG
jgi:hypothetical protein